MTQTERQTESSGEHPSLQTLASYHEGRLSEAEADRIRSHLVECRHCAGIVLDLSEVSETSEFVVAFPGDVDGAWKPLKDALVTEGLLPKARDSATAASLGTWKALALAASVAAVVFAGTSAWLWEESRNRIDSQVDPPWASLMPEGELRYGEPETMPELRLPPGTRGWISLNYSTRATSAFLRARFYSETDGTIVWEWSGTRPEDPGSLRIELTPREVPEGRYRVELDGRVEPRGTWENLARYSIRVTVPEEP